MLSIFKINKYMDKEPKLKTKLDFRFNTDDMEVPEMGFIIEDPLEDIPTEIRVLEKKRPTRKTTKKLF